jgi:hypothetical protein
MGKHFQEILKSEEIIRNEPAMWIKSDDQTEHGRLILTRKRLFFAKNVMDTSALSRHLMTNQHLEPKLEIDLDTINVLSRSSFVTDHNILSINYMQYETARFSVIHYEEWEKDLQAARMIPDIPGDPNKDTKAA